MSAACISLVTAFCISFRKIGACKLSSWSMPAGSIRAVFLMKVFEHACWRLSVSGNCNVKNTSPVQAVWIRVFVYFRRSTPYRARRYVLRGGLSSNQVVDVSFYQIGLASQASYIYDIPSWSESCNDPSRSHAMILEKVLSPLSPNMVVATLGEPFSILSACCTS